MGTASRRCRRTRISSPRSATFAPAARSTRAAATGPRRSGSPRAAGRSRRSTSPRPRSPRPGRRPRPMGPDVAERVDWVEGDLATWTPQPGRFDLVVCLYVHVAGSVEEMVRRMADGVAPGGTLFLVGHRPIDPATGRDGRGRPGAGLRRGRGRRARSGRWELVVAEERPRSQARQWRRRGDPRAAPRLVREGEREREQRDRRGEAEHQAGRGGARASSRRAARTRRPRAGSGRARAARPRRGGRLRPAWRRPGWRGRA